eukprot:gene2234-2948_t
MASPPELPGISGFLFVEDRPGHLDRSLNRKTAVSRSVEDWCEVAVGNNYGGSATKGYATWKELEGVAKDLYDSPVIDSAIQEWWSYMGFEVSGRMSKDEYTVLCTCLQQTLAPQETVDEEKLNIIASAEWDRNYGKYAVTVGFKEFKKEIFSLVSCWTMEHNEDAFELFLKSKMNSVGDHLAAKRAANPSRFKKGPAWMELEDLADDFIIWETSAAD